MSEEAQPAEALALVGAEGALKLGRGVEGLDAGELLEAVAGLGEAVVNVDQLFFVEQGVEDRGLGRFEAEVVAIDFAERREQAVLVEPLLGHEGLAAVAEGDHGLAAAGRGEDLGEGEGLFGAVFLGVGDVAAELEPVDAGGDGEGGGAGGSDDGLVGGHDPAAADEGGDGAGHLFGRHQHDVTGGGGGVAEAEPGGGGDGLALAAEVAADERLVGGGLVAGRRVVGRGAAVVEGRVRIVANVHRGGVGRGGVVARARQGLAAEQGGVGQRLGRGAGGGADGSGLVAGNARCPRSGLRRGGRHRHEAATLHRAHALPGVVEPHPTDEAVARRTAHQPARGGRTRAVEVQVRHRLDQRLAPAEALGQVQLGQLRQEVQPLEELAHVRRVDLQRRVAHRRIHHRVLDLARVLVGVAGVAELAHPAVGVAVVERGGHGHRGPGVAADRTVVDDDAVTPAQHDRRVGHGDAFARAAELQVDHEPVAGGVADEPELPRLVVARPAEGPLVRAVLVLVFVELEEAAAGVDHLLEQGPAGAGGDSVSRVGPFEPERLPRLVVGDPGRPEQHRHQLAVDRVGERVDGVEADLQRLGLAPARGDGAALLQVDDEAVVPPREVGHDDVGHLPLGREDRRGKLGGVLPLLGRGTQQRQAAHPLGLGDADRAERVVALARLGWAELEFAQVAGLEVAGAVVVRVEFEQGRPDVLAVRPRVEVRAGALGRGLLVLGGEGDGVDLVAVLHLRAEQGVFAGLEPGHGIGELERPAVHPVRAPRKTASTKAKQA